MPNSRWSPRSRRGGLFGSQPVIVGRFQRRLQRSPVIPGVVGRAGGRGEGKGVGGKVIAAAHLSGIHVDLGGEEIHRPLYGRGGLRATGPSEGVYRGGVGGYRGGRPGHVGNVVVAA